MKLSLNWLNKFLSLDDISPEEVAKKLTMYSFEVEEIQKVGHKLKGPIVVGRILEIEKHPNADRLSVTKVTTDGSNQIQIVCGAKNIKVGQTIPVSLEGAVVVNCQDGSELAIKKTKIRNIDSSGMLCSPGELGINVQDSEGILILPENAKLGQSIVDCLSLTQDTVLEVAARSNRGDALSVFGLSKEISALTGRKLKEIRFNPPKTDKSVKIIQSKIENTKDTYLFYTATLENINVSESPAWLKNLLEAIGIRSINNIVDITNYINFTFGQPMHAYDKAKLKGSTLTARLAKKGEKIVTLDDKKHELTGDILVIADEECPVAIAGIMGGKESEVSESTKDIVLEAAVFNPVRVRRGSRALGLASEASKRFERGVDSNFTYNALLYAIELIQQTSGDDYEKIKVGQIHKSGEPSKKEVTISLVTSEVTRVLGISLNTKEIQDMLESLEFKCSNVSKDSLEVHVPSFRTQDVSRPRDLIEEIARLYGYDKIPVNPPLSTIAANKSLNELNIIKRHFLASGFSEAYLSSLIGEKTLSNKEFTFDETRAVSMLNPLSKEHSVLRQTLIPGLLEALKLNQSHQATTCKLFEIGKAYFFEDKNKPSEKETCVREVLKIAGIVSGIEDSWFEGNVQKEKLVEFLFFLTKGILEDLLSRKNCSLEFIQTQENFLHPRIALKILLNKKGIGRFGCLHPELEKKYEFVSPVILFEIDLEPVLAELTKTKSFEKISSQPLVTRDITIDLLKKYDANLVQNEISKITSGFVKDITLISLYELDSENKSLTFRLKMQDPEQTLTGNQVDEEINKIKDHLSACIDAKFRV